MNLTYLNFHRRSAISLILVIACASIATPLFAGFQDDYDKALATFRAAKAHKDYQDAASQFAALCDRKDSGALKANALFWLAECFYGLREYARALNTFERVLLIPRSNKEEDSRYKVAICCVKLGWQDTARWELTRFLRDYPSSAKIDLVRKELSKLPAGNPH